MTGIVRRNASLLDDLFHKRVPGQLVIQITDRCNASCPQCGMRVSEEFRRTKLPLDDVKRILDSAAEKGVRVVSFTGGEPFLYPDELIQMIRHAGKAGIRYIRTGTNGYFLRNAGTDHGRSRVKRIAESLAGTSLRNLWISLDSAVPSVHERMRGLTGVVEGIEQALPLFHECGIYPAVNLGINRCMGDEPHAVGEVSVRGRHGLHESFKESFRKYYRFVIDLGFTMVNACYPMSVDTEEGTGDLDPVYAATSVDDVVRFARAEKILLFKALMEVIPEFRDKIRIFSPRTSLLALHRECSHDLQAAFPCRGGLDFFFIDSRDGNTYPCGYRGSESMGRFWDLDRGACSPHAFCKRCDWECFRDPSELFGPVLQGLSDPRGLLKRVFRDPEYFRVWAQDVQYYRACDFFDGRKPPDLRRLRRFSPAGPASIRFIPYPDLSLPLR